MTQDVLYAPPTPADGAAKTAAGKSALKRGVASILAAAGGAYGLLAVLTYSPDDPSFNVATDAAPSNLLGAPGAVFADLAVQSLGAAAPAALLALTAAGVLRIVSRRFAAPVPTARFGVGALGILFAAGLVAFLPTPGAWPLASGFGGLVGDLVGGVLAGLTRLAGLPGADIVAALLCAAAATACFIWAYRVPRTALSALASGAGAAAVAAVRQGHNLVQRRAAPQTYEPVAPEPAYAPADPDPLRPMAYAPQHEPIPTPQPQPIRRTPVTLRPEPAPQPPRPAPQPTVFARPQPQAQPQQPQRAVRPVQQELPLSLPREFRLPAVDLLSPARPRASHADGAALQATSRRLAEVLADFGVQGEIVAARPGPVVTLFELEPAPGVKSSRVIGLADDIARSMSATAARVAVIPGRNAIGIELPNPKRETVYLRTLLDSNAFIGNQGALPLALGESIEGEPFAADLSRMPHLLIAGTTGSGKSVGINAMILSLLYRLTPEECRFIMIDPKMLELSVYEGIPHLLSPVVTDPKKAVVALKWTVREMEERYRRMSKLGVRNIQGYNERVADAIASGEKLERSVHAGFDPETGEPIYETRSLPLEPMPFIVVVIDEMADLMMVAGKEIEAAVQRLAQMARAAGIHLIMATQRPSVDVITGTIKANFPTRISYSVTSKIDSRTILGEQGAEQLLGMGDLLYMAGGGKILRLHGPFVHDDDVGKVVNWLKAQGAPTYRADVLEEPDSEDDEADASAFYSGEEGGEDIYERAVQIVQRDRKASTSYLQRRLQVGYNRAASLIERMEKEGIVSAANHANKREVLLPKVNDD